MKLTKSLFSSAYIPVMLSLSASVNLALYAPATSAQAFNHEGKSPRQIEYETRKKLEAGKSISQLDKEMMERENILGRGDMAELRRYQNILKRLGFNPGTIDGHPGRHTTSAVVRFQRSVGLNADGILGPFTKRALREASRTNSNKVATSDQDFAAYQQLLKDNGFDPGKNTTEAIRRFQRSAGLAPDGILGPVTKTALKIVNQSKVVHDTKSAERRIIQSDDPDKLHLINPETGREYSDVEIAAVLANDRARQQIEIEKAENKIIQSEDPDKLHLINPANGHEYTDAQISDILQKADRQQSDVIKAEIKIINSDDPDKLHLINPATGREYTDPEIANVLNKYLKVEDHTSTLQAELSSNGLDYDDSDYYSVKTALETTYSNDENRVSIESLALQYDISTALLAGVVASEMAFDHDFYFDYIQDGVWRSTNEGSGSVVRDTLGNLPLQETLNLTPFNRTGLIAVTSISVDDVYDNLVQGVGIASVHTETLIKSVHELEKKYPDFQYNESIMDPAYRSTMHGSIESAAIVLKYMGGEYNSTGDFDARDMATIWGGYRNGVIGLDAEPGDKHGYTSVDNWRNGISRKSEMLEPQLKVGKNAYMSVPLFEYFEDKYP